ncbi:MAG: UbiX family flavin prenyltransferase, partial [Deltaproteobacteria bacterium]|nr:UbiX family flavin prenyltransferase [Deltaproteobacteria bacterium]
MRLVVGISGASGVEMGYSLLKALRDQPDCETHLVMTEGAKTTWRKESSRPLEDVAAAADYHYGDGDLTAAIASGTFATAGMAVLPCSMKTLSAVANGYAAGLLTRAADVCLKEGRKL